MRIRIPKPVARKIKVGKIFEKAVKGYKIRKREEKQKPIEAVFPEGYYPPFGVAKGVVMVGEKLKPEGITISEKVGVVPKKKEAEIDFSKVNIIYPLIGPPKSPFASANIKWSKAESALIYYVIEPFLTPEEKDLLERIKTALIEKLDIDFTTLRKGEARNYLRGKFQEMVSLMTKELPIQKQANILYYVERDFIGLGKIEPFMQDPSIEDISCDGVGIPIFIYHRNPMIGSIRTNVVFETADELDLFVNKLAQRCGKTISVASPLVGAALPDGNRVQATLGTDIARRGSNFCIKEGYVQLANGSIEDIKCLFESWKNYYGSKIDEYGNEVVIVKDKGIVGVNEKNLKQENAKILQIVKLKPPENLVRIEFKERGKTVSSIEVTKNHMFHILTENEIKIIPAEKLRKGMWIPVPTKIEIDNHQKKDYLEILIRALLNFQKSTVYVKIDNDMFPLIKISKSKSRLKDIKRRKINSIPLEEFLENLKLSKMDVREFKELRCILRKGSRGRCSEIKFPLKLNKELSYLIGWIIGDGSLTKDNISIHVGLNKNYKRSVLKYLKKNFDVDGKTYKNDSNRIYVNSRILAKILHECFSIPYGKKSRSVSVPKIIEKSSIKIIANFLKGLFESDGSFVDCINLTTFSRELATKVIFLLERFGIYSSFNKANDAFRIYVPSAYYSKFLKEICSNKQIRMLVEKQRKTKISNILPSFIINPLHEEMKKIGILKYGYKIINFNEARKGGIISFNKVRALNNLVKQYKENETTFFIDRLLNGDLEFKQIVNINVLKNKEMSHVYDVSCNPVSFYIGGKDSPLFLHDTIRKFTEEPLTPIDIIKFKSIDAKIAAYLWTIIEYGRSLLITGGVASGKTTLLNALSLFIKPDLKVITIEDTPELKLPHPHWVPSVARQPIVEVEGRRFGEVDLFDLLRESLRQRPDYLIVGEVRGKEAYVLFQQIATGHASMSTIHADSMERLMDRLTTPPISLPPSLIEALDIIIFIVKIKHGKSYVRRVSNVYEIIGFDREINKPVTNEVFAWDPITDTYVTKNPSLILKKICEQHGISEEFLQREIAQRIKVINWMTDRDIRNYRDVAKVVKMYYTRTEDLLNII